MKTYARLIILSLMIIVSLNLNAQSVPHQSAPVNGSTWDSTMPTLHWWYMSATGSETYSVQVSTSSSDFTTPGVVKVNATLTGGGSASYAIPSSAGLFVGLKYYWRIGVNGNYSSVWSFTPSSGNIPNYYTLTTSVPGSNGSVSITPVQTNYISGSVVQLTAVADPGYYLLGWGGDASGLTNPLSVTMDGDKNITATFAPIPTYALTVSANGDGSVVKLPDQPTYLAGSIVNLTANPDPGAEFTSWSGDASGNANPLSVSIDGDKNITANFNTFNFENILIAPANNSEGLQTLNFVWHSRAGVASYKIRIFSDSFHSMHTVNDTTFTYIQTFDKQTYQWNVEFMDGGTLVTSSTWSFTVDGLDIPEITSPTQEETGVELLPTPVVWTPVPNAASYFLAVISGNTVVHTNTITGANNYDIPGLSGSTEYSVVVTAYNGLLESQPSETITFTTGEAPGIFSLLTPNWVIGGANEPAGNVRFLWEKSRYATSYNLIVNNVTNPAIPFIELDTTVTDTSLYGVLSPSSDYTWNVEAINSISSVLSSNGLLAFSTADTFFVATYGNDSPSNGSESNPFRTIQYAYSNTPQGSVIKVQTGSYPEDVVIYHSKTVIGYGGASPRISSLSIGSSNINIKNFDLDNSTTMGSNGLYMSSGMPGMIDEYQNVIIENINIIPGSNFLNGLNLDWVSGIKFIDCDFSYSSNFGILIDGCQNISLDGINCNFNQSIGMLLLRGSNINISNAVVKGNNIGIGTAGGIEIVDLVNSSFSNMEVGSSLPAPFQTYGLHIISASNLVFDNCSFSDNSQNGVYLDPQSNYGSMTTITNLTFKGGCVFENNGVTGLFAMPKNIGYFISGINILDDCTFTNNASYDVILIGDISHVTIDGAKFDNTVSTSIGIEISSGGFGNFPIAPKEVTISNTFFRGFDASDYAIELSMMAMNDVDARNNIFADATDIADIDRLVFDVLDDPTLGDVITDGSSFGTNPEYVVESQDPAYTGASYLLDIDFYPKSESYLSLSGIFTYDTTKLEYVGFLNDGMINDNSWANLNITENITASSADLTFTAWGLNPISSGGKLFTLSMRVKSDAAPSPGTASIIGFPADFFGLTTSGPPVNPFVITDGVISFSTSNSPVQSKGDVNLDGIVEIDDFNILLLYIFGNTSMITDLQALDNADYDNDGDIDSDDLTALFNFINGITTPTAPVLAGGSMGFDQLQFIQEYKSISIPITLNDVENLNSFEIILKYDPEIIDYQSFNTSLETERFHALGYEVEPGIAKYTVYTKDKISGSLRPCKLLLRFIDETVPDNSEIFTQYRFNGRNYIDGPVITISDGAITDLEQELIPEVFEVSQNYPNPFNPSTSIRFNLTQAGEVSIKVYNMLGEEIKTLANSAYNPGFHQVVWNGDDNSGSQVASGTYIYRVISGSKSITKKMLLLK